MLWSWDEDTASVATVMILHVAFAVLVAVVGRIWPRLPMRNKWLSKGER